MCNNASMVVDAASHLPHLLTRRKPMEPNLSEYCKVYDLETDKLLGGFCSFTYEKEQNKIVMFDSIKNRNEEMDEYSGFYVYMPYKVESYSLEEVYTLFTQAESKNRKIRVESISDPKTHKIFVEAIEAQMETEPQEKEDEQ